MATKIDTLSGAEIVELSRRHTIYEWSVQSAVDPIPVARAKGIYFWTPEGKRFIDRLKHSLMRILSWPLKCARVWPPNSRRLLLEISILSSLRTAARKLTR